DFEIFALRGQTLRLHFRTDGSAAPAAPAPRGGRLGAGGRHAFLSEIEEALILPGGRGLVGLPEFRIVNREHAGIRPHDDFGGKPAARAQLDELPDVAVNIDIAFACAAPPDGNAGGGHPDVGVAHVAGQHVRMQGFEGEVRVFESAHRIAGIDADADKVASRAFDQHFQFARLHVPGVIFNGDFDVGRRGLAANIFQNLSRVFDVAFERNFAGALGCAAQNAADNGRTDDRGRFDHAPELFFRRALRGIEHGRGGADRLHADFEIDVQILRVVADLRQVVRFEIAQKTDFAEV